MLDLVGKNVLLICPKFYGYEFEIKNELIEKGAKINIIYENLDEVGAFFRFVYVYLPNLRNMLNDNYFERKSDNANIEDADYVFVIRGSSLTRNTLERMREKAKPSCKFVLYQWDGVQNNPAILNIVDFFDKISTFDCKDSEKYGWQYRPLFFISRYVRDQVRKNDLLYICSLHSNRAALLNRVKLIAQENGYSLETNVYIKRLIYFKRKYLDKRFDVVDAKRNDVSFRPLSIKDSYQLYGASRVVIDYTHPGQTGYTMRTIEALGNGCKLITNNREIEKADFYSQENILIYNNVDIRIPSNFVTRPYTSIASEVYERYSLSQWISDILGEVI